MRSGRLPCESLRCPLLKFILLLWGEGTERRRSEARTPEEMKRTAGWSREAGLRGEERGYKESLSPPKKGFFKGGRGGE